MFRILFTHKSFVSDSKLIFFGVNLTDTLAKTVILKSSLGVVQVVVVEEAVGDGLDAHVRARSCGFYSLMT